MSDRIIGADPGCSRRRVLAALGAGSAGALAGCLTGAVGDSTDETDAEATVVASFFTFYDFADRIARETPVSVENLVPVGMHGHGWEPDPSITRDIVDADAFVHVGPGFQPWADRAIDVVHDDGANTRLIDVREEVDLIDLVESVGEEEEVGEGKDPHFWLDPERAAVAVDAIVDGLVAVAPDHEDRFRENADDLAAELDAIDDEWTSIVEAAERETVFFAAHNAFQYVADRYGIEIHPLIVNLAASDDVRPADMRRARETIADNDIEYIGAAVFEPRKPARQLLEETDVRAYYPVTPFAGTREDWVDRGWGYAEIARQINMETFRIVLGAADPDETSLGEAWRNFE